MKEIQGQEHAERAALEHEEQQAEQADIPRAPRRRGQRERGDDAGEQHEQEAEAVEAEAVVDVQRADPGVLLRELVADHGRVEAGEDDEAQDEGREAAGEREAARGAVGQARQRREGEGAGPREEHEQGEQGQVVHRAPPQTSSSARMAKAMATVRM